MGSTCNGTGSESIIIRIQNGIKTDKVEKSNPRNMAMIFKNTAKVNSYMKECLISFMTHYHEASGHTNLAISVEDRSYKNEVTRLGEIWDVKRRSHVKRKPTLGRWEGGRQLDFDTLHDSRFRRAWITRCRRAVRGRRGTHCSRQGESNE